MKKLLITVLVLAIIIVAGFAGSQYLKSRPVPVKSALSSKGTIIEYVSASGQIQAQSSLGVFSPASGKITKVYVGQGDWVDEDDKIIKIEDYGKVKSPMDGTVVNMDWSKDDYITRGKQIATIADLSPVYTIAQVDESDIGKVKVGQPTKVDLDSYPDAKVRGAVSSISMISSKTTSGGTAFPVKIKITSVKGAKIRLGMSADVEIEVARKTDVVKVPIEAVDSRNGKDVVIIIEGGKARMKTVEIGLSTEDDYEALKGVAAGEKLAVSNLNILKNGSNVAE